MQDFPNVNGEGHETPLEREIKSLGPWFHNLHLPDGTQTAPDHQLGDYPTLMWQKIARELPQDLSEWSVLDVGCNAGYYSLELARRGAMVTGIDVDEHYLTQARWAAAHYELADQVTFRQMQVYDVARQTTRYDLVLFLGVFCHLRYPLLAMDILAEKTRRLMAFHTLTVPGRRADPNIDRQLLENRIALQGRNWPKLAFIQSQHGGNHSTDWWAPNDAAVEAVLESSGLRVVVHPDNGEHIYICEPSSHSEVDVSLFRAQQRAATGT